MEHGGRPYPVHRHDRDRARGGLYAGGLRTGFDRDGTTGRSNQQAVLPVRRPRPGLGHGHDRGTRASTSFWTIFPGHLGSLPPHTRRVLCFTWLPCLLDADWCLRSDVTTDSRLQAATSRSRGSSLRRGTALSSSISTVLTGLSWIYVGVHSRRALPSPVCA